MIEQVEVFDTTPTEIYVRLRDDYGKGYWELVPGLEDTWEAIRLLGDRFIYFKYADRAPVVWAPFGLGS